MSSTGTVRIHRVIRASPERVYRAFLDADALAKWLPPHGFTGKVHALDAKVGGAYRMSFTDFTTGRSHAFGGEYLELVPHERIRYTGVFDDANLPGAMQTTVSLRKVICGVELDVVQEGIPAVIPVEMCYLGWQESIELLVQLVEPEIRQLIQLADYLNPAVLLWGLLFSTIGLAYFTYGKKRHAQVPLWCGVVLMVYPYFVTHVPFLVGIGVVLSVVPYFWRR